MHFLDAWSRLPLYDHARLLLPVACVILSIVLPGRRPALLGSLGLALGTLLMREISPWALRLGWTALWLAIALRSGVPRAAPVVDPAARRGGFESGAVGVLLGFSLMLLLTAAVARQDLPPEQSRRVSYGLTLLILGLLHLMLRRHVMRAVVAFAALGLGIELLEQAARGTLLPPAAPATGGVLLATAIVVALLARLAAGRERAVGTAWVSQAHDLHD